MSMDTILNFIRIDERVCTGGQPTRAQLEAARLKGVQAVVNLAPHDADNHALPDEESVVEALGMRYHHIPVPWTDPRPEHFNAFGQVMQDLKDRQESVLIHCAANFRVSVFFALYAAQHEGWSAERADQLIARIWESRPDYRMDDTWKAFVARMR